MSPLQLLRWVNIMRAFQCNHLGRGEGRHISGTLKIITRTNWEVGMLRYMNMKIVVYYFNELHEVCELLPFALIAIPSNYCDTVECSSIYDV